MPAISRRSLLQRAGAATLALSGGGFAALGALDAEAEPHSTLERAHATKGGTLRAAITGGSSADTVDPAQANLLTDWARVQNLYDPLAALDANGRPSLVLATEITPNATATEWTVRIREGIEFHNGKTLTADDIIFTYQRILNPKKPGIAAAGLAAIDAAHIVKLDKYTVKIPCHTPFATLVEAFSVPLYSSIVPVGFDPAHPVGTGPFKFVSFTAGDESVFARNTHYWQSGKPYLDEIVITDYQDETSQINALISGQADVVNDLSAASTAAVRSGGGHLLISDGGGWNPFTMRVDVPPFNDVRVRQAMRLLVDRPQMQQLVYGGYGTVGNDVFGIFAPEYNHSLPQRSQDVEKAKSLLKQAGRSDLSVELVTADIAQGVINASEVFAQQAQRAGIKVQLRQVTVSSFFGNGYLKYPFGVDYWLNNLYYPQVGLTLLPKSDFNTTHWANPRYTKLYTEAIGTVDAGRRTAIAHEMQTIDYDEGGYIIPAFAPVIDGYASHVHGLGPTKSGLPLNSDNWAAVWKD